MERIAYSVDVNQIFLSPLWALPNRFMNKVAWKGQGDEGYAWIQQYGFLLTKAYLPIATECPNFLVAIEFLIVHNSPGLSTNYLVTC